MENKPSDEEALPAKPGLSKKQKQEAKANEEESEGGGGQTKGKEEAEEADEWISKEW